MVCLFTLLLCLWYSLSVIPNSQFIFAPSCKQSALAGILTLNIKFSKLFSGEIR